MNIIAPPSLRSPAKASRWPSSSSSSSSCLKNSSKFRSFLIFIGFVGLLFINNYKQQQQQQSVENGLLRKTNHLHQTVSSSSSSGEEVQLDFAVVGFEKTGTYLRLISTCCTILFYILIIIAIYPH